MVLIEKIDETALELKDYNKTKKKQQNTVKSAMGLHWFSI